MKWILFPGLGTDARLFEPIIELLPDPQVIEFITPAPKETIEMYAQRLIGHARLQDPVVLAGTSLGGMIAAILSETLNPRALVLMSSTPTPLALTRAARGLERMSRVMPSTAVNWMRSIPLGGKYMLGPIDVTSLQLFREMARHTPIETLRQGARLGMEWRRPPKFSCPFFHIHGTRDKFISIHRVHPTHTIPGAGHLLNLTHPRELRTIIQEIRHQIA
ncbi:MAG: hypothetical protein HJJLKODD_02874 [Phycisphaerae bacterium]|nr:hypothetical protein [Phycisphaerae bacterium]